ncbi:MAG: hypothetical protein ABEI39_06120 [Halobacteriales archaeon]
MSTESAHTGASLTSSTTVSRWVIYLVAAIIAAFIIKYGIGGASISYAVVMGVATGLAVDIADAVVLST